MNVASLEICKSLYELSGLDYPTIYWQEDFYEDGSVNWNLYHDNENKLRTGRSVPAYDAGYLLRILPYNFIAEGAHYNGDYQDNLFYLDINFNSNQDAKYSFLYSNGEESLYFTPSNTPEDALALLAIKLYENGILKKGELEDE